MELVIQWYGRPRCNVILLHGHLITTIESYVKALVGVVVNSNFD